MKQWSLFLYSILFIHSDDVFAASCCVSNTNVSNLMLLPSKWQETLTVSQGRVIGDVNEKGASTFRRSSNRDVTTLGRLDLAYGWTGRYQSGVSFKYLGRTRELNGESSNSSGWSDLGLTQGYQIFPLKRLWLFHSVNIPTARSIYDSSESFSVDARGTGTYQTSFGVFGISNRKEWDFLYSYEVHRSLEKKFDDRQTQTRVSGFWGTSFTGGAGYIPWRSKARYGVNLAPRYEGPKDVTINGKRTAGKSSLVWDSTLNFSYTLSASHAFGLSYTDQTIFGPVRNSLLSRIIGFQWQTKWQ
jgi:hypothetical protein